MCDKFASRNNMFSRLKMRDVPIAILRSEAIGEPHVTSVELRKAALLPP